MTWKLALVFATAVSCFAQAPLVTGVGNFIHDMADLDRSVHFYKDVLGMDVPRPAGDWQTGEAVLNLYDAAGAKFRVSNAQIPGSPMRVEMVEFNGVDRKPVQRRWGAPGNSILMLTVADFGPVEQRLEAAKVPMLVKLKKACDGRGVVIADPDGFPIMIVEKGAAGSPPAPPLKSNFTGLRFGYLTSGDAMEKDVFGALGVKAQIRTHICQPIEEALVSGRGSPSIVTLPGGFEVWLFKAKSDAAKHAVVRPHDPGAGVLRLPVTDIDAAVKALAQTKVKIVSAGGAIQTLPGGLKAAILGAPDDLLVQVLK